MFDVANTETTSLTRQVIRIVRTPYLFGNDPFWTVEGRSKAPSETIVSRPVR